MGDKSPKSKRKNESQKQAKVHKLKREASEDTRPALPPSPAGKPAPNGTSSKD